MSYKTILVHIDDSQRSNARVEFAVDFALKHDAHLIGLYVVCQDLLRPLFRRDESLNLAVNEAQSAARQQRARDHFTATAQRAGVNGEWRAPPGPAIENATLHARHADLLILGQQDPSDPAAHIARHFLEDILMGSGRPAIVLPYAGRVERFGDTVLIAWDGGQAIARAVQDALPILQRARFVEIVCVTRHPDEGEPAGLDLATYLERQNVRAGFRSLLRVSGVSTGATLLNALADTNSDLLVLGAYGHARAEERVLGGVTRTMLESMITPVFMSH
ncbi:universal stress protein [Caballeronia sp. LjRoot34]|uniref:universal stress protein n=1 Tax=Caballeronia sp. LjRoot34 TaxID=3342325 RepID=UPI003ED0EA00